MKKLIIIAIMVFAMCFSVVGVVLLSHDEIVAKNIGNTILMNLQPLATYQDGFLCSDIPVKSGYAYSDTPVVCTTPRCHLLTYTSTYNFRANSVMTNGMSVSVTKGEVYELYTCSEATRNCGDWQKTSCGVGGCDSSEMQYKEVCTQPVETNLRCVPQPECRASCSVKADCSAGMVCYNGGCVTDLTPIQPTPEPTQKGIIGKLWDWIMGFLKSLFGVA